MNRISGNINIIPSIITKKGLLESFFSNYTTRKKEIISQIFGNIVTSRIFVTVFHRILDFKNGAGFLSWPLLF